jgi:hypothetical protein
MFYQLTTKHFIYLFEEVHLDTSKIVFVHIYW